MHASDFPSSYFHSNIRVDSFLNRSSVRCEAEASCCAVGTYHPSLSGAKQVKVMNLIQVPDKRLLFKATVPLIFRCAYRLRVEGWREAKSPLKLENNYSNFFSVSSFWLFPRRNQLRSGAAVYILLYVRFYVCVLKSVHSQSCRIINPKDQSVFFLPAAFFSNRVHYLHKKST